MEWQLRRPPEQAGPTPVRRNGAWRRVVAPRRYSESAEPGVWRLAPAWSQPPRKLAALKVPTARHTRYHALRAPLPLSRRRGLANTGPAAVVVGGSMVREVVWQRGREGPLSPGPGRLGNRDVSMDDLLPPPLSKIDSAPTGETSRNGDRAWSASRIHAGGARRGTPMPWPAVAQCQCPPRTATPRFADS